MRRTLIGALGLLCSATATSAQWLHKIDEDPFGGDRTAIAFTAAGGYGFGFNCKGKHEFRLVYLTTEEANKNTAAMNLLAPRLKIRVDNLPPVEFDAELDAAGEKVRVTASDTGVLSTVKAMVSARDRVAVAVELGGQRFHIQNFSVGGSKAAIVKALKACGLDGQPS